ncbi:MAG: hypothetical protein WDW38_005249 [Sanguina aurantia]
MTSMLKDLKDTLVSKLGGQKYHNNLLGESLADLLRKATAKVLTEPDEELNQQVVDTVHQEVASGKETKEIALLLKKRLRTDNPLKQWLGVLLLGKVMRDCSADLGMHQEDLLQEVARVMARPAKPDSEAGKRSKAAAKELLRTYGRAAASAFRAVQREGRPQTGLAASSVTANTSGLPPEYAAAYAVQMAGNLPPEFGETGDDPDAGQTHWEVLQNLKDAPVTAAPSHTGDLIALDDLAAGMTAASVAGPSAQPAVEAKQAPVSQLTGGWPALGYLSPTPDICRRHAIDVACSWCAPGTLWSDAPARWMLRAVQAVAPPCVSCQPLAPWPQPLPTELTLPAAAVDITLRACAGHVHRATRPHRPRGSLRAREGLRHHTGVQASFTCGPSHADEGEACASPGHARQPPVRAALDPFSASTSYQRAPEAPAAQQPAAPLAYSQPPPASYPAAPQAQMQQQQQQAYGVPQQMAYPQQQQQQQQQQHQPYPPVSSFSPVGSPTGAAQASVPYQLSTRLSANNPFSSATMPPAAHTPQQGAAAAAPAAAPLPAAAAAPSTVDAEWEMFFAGRS